MAPLSDLTGRKYRQTHCQEITDKGTFVSEGTVALYLLNMEIRIDLQPTVVEDLVSNVFHQCDN